jgi:AcrR family transcriptional regulator
LDFNFPSNYEEINDTHLQILQEAVKILGKKGSAGLELKNIAKILDISPGNIHHYYKTGEELILDTVMFSYQNYVTGIQSQNASETDPEKIIRSWIDNTIEWTTEFPGIGVILEFPNQVIRSGSRYFEDAQPIIQHFLKHVGEIGLSNVSYLASAIRSLQKKQDFKQYNGLQIATFNKTDVKFVTYLTVIGFATLGGGLWMAGRQPENQKLPFWINIGFNPKQQMQTTIDELIKMIKSEK